MAYRETMQRSLEGLATTRGAKQQQKKSLQDTVGATDHRGPETSVCSFVCLFGIPGGDKNIPRSMQSCVGGRI